MRCARPLAALASAAWWPGAHVWLWFMVNRKLFRPWFDSLNMQAFEEWKCPMSRSLTTTTNTTGLEVIVASPDGTGTTTLHLMLESLGLRTYHTEEVLFYFEDFVSAYCQNKADISRMVEPIKTCGVQAICVNPLLELTEVLVPASPGVKVLYGKREWHDWQRSSKVKQSQFAITWFVIGWNLLLCHLFPHGLFWYVDALSHASFLSATLTSVMLNQCLTYGSIRGVIAMGRLHKRSKAGLADHQGAMLENETAYDVHKAAVQQLVPPEDFLEFDFARHGWGELAAFVGRPPPPAGTPMPSLKARSFSPASAQLQLYPRHFATFWALMLLAASVNYVAFRIWVRFVLRCVKVLWRMGLGPLQAMLRRDRKDS